VNPGQRLMLQGTGAAQQCLFVVHSAMIPD
jgi:hypothetical protein